jgi:hypothetical protein
LGLKERKIGGEVKDDNGKIEEVESWSLGEWVG